ncbi:MAG TPA: hypothetical protein PLM29_11315 [Deltaproteobacteria bacterium]|nr:hypothetical protein [Deltaproteobacteria bacterium]
MNNNVLIIFLCMSLWISSSAMAAPATPPAGDIEPATEGEPVDRSCFLEGYELFIDHKYRRACPYFYEFMQRYSPDVADYEWAEFFLGISLQKLGYSHASSDILAGLVRRKPNQKIVLYSLEVFENMSRTQGFDKDLIIDQTICGSLYGFVEGGLSDFIHYHQGVYDWEHGFISWGDEHFSQIGKGTYYHYKYLYKKALMCLYEDRIHECMAVLDEILGGSCEDEALLDEVLKTQARLLYELGEYERADMLYQELQQNILEQSRNLMERAWAHYRMGNPEKAMGLLYAFEAPGFRNHFTPEYYILKSFIYKDVCHYESALNVVSEFTARYGESLEGIYHRLDAGENRDLLVLILNKKDIHFTWELLNLLEEERFRITEFRDRKDQDSDLSLYLDRIYDLEIAKVAGTLRHQVQAEYERYANQLLQYEEEANLMAYEVGLDMYQRVQQYHYSEDQEAKNEEEKGIVVYPFQGEFWNDELADYRVILPNKCKDMEEWDIFFR